MWASHGHRAVTVRPSGRPLAAFQENASLELGLVGLGAFLARWPHAQPRSFTLSRPLSGVWAHEGDNFCLQSSCSREQSATGTL